MEAKESAAKQNQIVLDKSKYCLIYLKIYQNLKGQRIKNPHAKMHLLYATIL